MVADLADPGSVPAVADRGGGAGRRASSTPRAWSSLGPVAELDADAWRSQLDVNLVAPALLTRALLPALRAARGTVVLVNSGAGQVAHPTWAAYAASKHGLKALADSLRAEEAEHGVRVTSVYPGPDRHRDAGAGPRPGGQGLRRRASGSARRRCPTRSSGCSTSATTRPSRTFDQAALRAQPAGSSTKTRIRRRSPIRCR